MKTFKQNKIINESILSSTHTGVLEKIKSWIEDGYWRRNSIKVDEDSKCIDITSDYECDGEEFPCNVRSAKKLTINDYKGEEFKIPQVCDKIFITNNDILKKIGAQTVTNFNYLEITNCKKITLDKTFENCVIDSVYIGDKCEIEGTEYLKNRKILYIEDCAKTKISDDFYYGDSKIQFTRIGNKALKITNLSGAIIDIDECAKLESIEIIGFANGINIRNCPKLTKIEYGLKTDNVNIFSVTNCEKLEYINLNSCKDTLSLNKLPELKNVTIENNKVRVAVFDKIGFVPEVNCNKEIVKS